MRLTEPAPAKVNLFLHVTGRRADGYHLLDSLAVFPGPGDVLHAEPADRLALEINGPFAAGLAANADNLVLRAARALALGRGARLVLEKNLPVASGIGGGSADAAATLRVLSRLWELDVPKEVAVSLGADVPVCLRCAPSRMAGVGDVLRPAPHLPRCGVLLVNPGVGVSTAEVFSRRIGPYRPAAELPARWSTASAMIDDLAGLHNDLEAPARLACPAVSDVLTWLRDLPGCRLARMSGSGATCFGLFEGEAPKAKPPGGWWAVRGAFGRDMP